MEVEYAGLVSDYPDDRAHFGFAYSDDSVFRIKEIIYLDPESPGAPVFYREYKPEYINYFDSENIYSLKYKPRGFRKIIEAVFRWVI